MKCLTITIFDYAGPSLLIRWSSGLSLMIAVKMWASSLAVSIEGPPGFTNPPEIATVTQLISRGSRSNAGA
jgi:hypothetical protein